MKLLTTIAGVLLSVVSLSGCATSSSLASLDIEGLKGVEFGQSVQEVKTRLPAFQMTPGPASANHKTYRCDGLTAS